MVFPQIPMPNRHLGGVNKEVSARKVVKQTDIEIGKYSAANDIHIQNLPPFDGSIGTVGKSGSSEKRYEVSIFCLFHCKAVQTKILKSNKVYLVRLRRVQRA